MAQAEVLRRARKRKPLRRFSPPDFDGGAPFRKGAPEDLRLRRLHFYADFTSEGRGGKEVNA